MVMPDVSGVPKGYWLFNRVVQLCGLLETAIVVLQQPVGKCQVFLWVSIAAHFEQTVLKKKYFRHPSSVEMRHFD